MSGGAMFSQLKSLAFFLRDNLHFTSSMICSFIRIDLFDAFIDLSVSSLYFINRQGSLISMMSDICCRAKMANTCYFLRSFVLEKRVIIWISIYRGGLIKC